MMDPSTGSGSFSHIDLYLREWEAFFKSKEYDDQKFIKYMKDTTDLSELEIKIFVAKVKKLIEKK